MDSHISNENSELKSFILSLRSGNLLKLIESNQSHFQDKCSSMCAKVRQSEEEVTRQLLILQQNSHLIEKFQNQLQELSKQNSELFEQQQLLNEENESLKNQLQCSEDKFAQLDIAYDEEASALTERVIELQTRIKEFDNKQNESNSHFDEAHAELYVQLKQFNEINADLKKQLTNSEDQWQVEKNDLKAQIDKASELNETLSQKISNYEEKIRDLQSSLTVALAENKQTIELKDELEKLNNDRDAERNEYRNEKSRLITVNEDLKLVTEDLKKKLSSKEKETEDVYLKFKQLTRFGTTVPGHPTSIQSSKYSTRKRSSTDDPKPIENSSDSDGSSISFYKFPKKRSISTESEDENQFIGFQNPINMEKKRRPSILANKSRASVLSSTANRRRPYSVHQQHIEIPESPVVSSSAVTNGEQKL